MNYTNNPVEAFASSVYCALSLHLPVVQFQYQTYEQRKANLPGEIRERRPEMSEIHIYHFPQVWGSTALGFGGIGGQAMTTAYTTVVTCANGFASVFFNGRHAYTMALTPSLEAAIEARQMESVATSGKYSEQLTTGKNKIGKTEIYKDGEIYGSQG